MADTLVLLFFFFRWDQIVSVLIDKLLLGSLDLFWSTVQLKDNTLTVCNVQSPLTQKTFWS